MKGNSFTDRLLSKGVAALLLSIFILQFHPCSAQQAQNRPYVDDKLFHFGFQLGMNLSSFIVSNTEDSIQNPITGETDVYHARVSNLLPGFHVGFVTDLRLCRYLNLRFCPGLMFSSRTISYVKCDTTNYKEIKAGSTIDGSFGSKVDVLAIPVYLPLYLKWSAAREGNYRPYVIAGGGVSFNVSRDKDKPVLLNVMDYFAEVGFGCDLYFRWFKFCPEITYRIGFADQLCPISKRTDGNLSPTDYFYSNAISRLTNQCICITFNFE